MAKLKALDWPLEYDYTGKILIDIGVKKQPNKWVTLRALRVLQAVERQAAGLILPGDLCRPY